MISSNAYFISMWKTVKPIYLCLNVLGSSSIGKISGMDKYVAIGYCFCL